MIKTQDIEPIVDRFLNEAGLFLVLLKISPDNVIDIMIDGPHGVNLDQCVALSHAINAGLDREVEDYELTVSSAGLEQPFRVLPQYLKYVGKEVEVVLKSGKKLNATLLEATADQLTLQYEELQKVAGKKRKQPVTFTEIYLLTAIKTTKPIVKWKD